MARPAGLIRLDEDDREKGGEDERQVAEPREVLQKRRHDFYPNCPIVSTRAKKGRRQPRLPSPYFLS